MEVQSGIFTTYSFIPNIPKTVYYKTPGLSCFLILQSSENFSNFKPKMDPSLLVKRRNILSSSYSRYSTRSSTLAILFYLLCLISQCAVLCLVAQSCLTVSLCHPLDCSLPGSSVHWDSSGQNTGVGCHALLQGIFPIQRLNPGLPHCRQILYCLSHQGSLRILEWVAYPFFRRSS